jgi:hypothetical protein
MRNIKLVCLLVLFLGVFSHVTLAQNLLDGLIDTKNDASTYGSCAGVADLYARIATDGHEASRARDVSNLFQQHMRRFQGQSSFDANSARSSASGAKVSGQQINAAYKKCLRLLQ